MRISNLFHQQYISHLDSSYSKDPANYKLYLCPCTWVILKRAKSFTNEVKQNKGVGAKTKGGITKITLDTVLTHAVGLSLHKDIAVRTHTPVTALGVQTGPCPTQRTILNAFINIYRRIAQ